MLRAALTATLLLAACGPDDPGLDPCEQAAAHREECLGDYVTPPVCDPAAEAAAARILDMDCDQLATWAAGEQGKADGAFCDWLGTGCTPDEPIFTGPACAGASDCAAGDACIEQHCTAGVDSDEFAAVMDRWTDSAETGGNATRLLVDNVDTRALRNQMMAGARDSIHFTALLIEDDDAGWETVGLLADAARRGVEVRVVVDATTQYTFSSYRLLDSLGEAGVQVLPFNPVTEWAGLRWQIGISANQRLHEKILVVDGAEAIVGGRNVGDDYLEAGRWRDTCVYLTGPGVADVQGVFTALWDQLAAWERQAGCPQDFTCPGDELSGDPFYTPDLADAGGALTRPVYSDPRSQSTPHGYRAVLNLVRAARHTIYIANSYFVPPRRLRKHLKAAVARGVRVVVVTNSLHSTDAWWMYYASLNYYKELIGAGIEVYQYRGTETMHAKTLLVDGQVALVGSFNLDPRSATTNSEAMVLVRDGDAVGELADAFARDLAYSDRASADISVGDWIKAKAFRLVEPLL
ncbi:MAG TPA: phosphatidylserine/phosphatidylglycerophosphate/cardiolipin synthase family protein [Kofleriaceae bacterium]|nr:phosphatidylserine/phosphatidylglycerophosphate/cardiolipin synthase family protein [Kofleriaceae bacterium]